MLTTHTRNISSTNTTRLTVEIRHGQTHSPNTEGTRVHPEIVQVGQPPTSLIKVVIQVVHRRRAYVVRFDCRGAVTPLVLYADFRTDVGQRKA